MSDGWFKVGEEAEFADCLRMVTVAGRPSRSRSRT
jgi:hypothetical protein